MSVNSQNINSSAINSAANSTDNKLYPNKIFIKVIGKDSGFLAIRFLQANLIVKKLTNNSKIVKKDFTTFHVNKIKTTVNCNLAKIKNLSNTNLNNLFKLRFNSYIGRYIPISANLKISLKNINNIISIKALSSNINIGINDNTLLYKKSYTNFKDTILLNSKLKLHNISSIPNSISSTKLLVTNNKIDRLRNLGITSNLNFRDTYDISGTFGVNPSKLPISINTTFRIESILFDKAPSDRSFIIPFDYRYVIIPEEIKIMEVFKKQPADSYDYDFSYNEWLMGQDTVKSIGIDTTPNDATDLGGLVVVLYNLQGGKLKLWISGGKNGTTYKVTLTATTVENRIKQNEFKIKVKDI